MNDWIWTTVSGEGANTAMGLELAPMVEGCGLTIQHVRAEAEIDVDTLEQRLTGERRLAGSVYVRNMTFGVWAHKA